MKVHKFAVGTFIFGLAISPITVYAQNQQAVAKLLSKATATLEAARSEDKSSINLGSVKCVGVIPKKSPIIGVGQIGWDGVVTCQTNGNWGAPFIVRAKSTNMSSTLSDGNWVFVTFGDQFSSEDLLNYSKLGGKDVPLFLVQKDGTVLENSDSDIRIETDRQTSDVLNSMASSPETRSFLDSVRYKVRPNGHITWSARPPTEHPASKSDDSQPRVAGTNPLVSGEQETFGYGLYSYALVAHSPSDDELPVYKAFFKALLALPTAKGLVKDKTPLDQINITQIPTTYKTVRWEEESVDERVSFVLDYYDYARAAGILASLSQPAGTGPVIISVLTPVDVSKHPDPVLVVDVTLVPPEVMTANVAYFVKQASKEQFWNESTLDKMRLNLRNKLASSASAMGKSKEAVLAWITIQHAK
jgi:hypothetical protein